ncbi:hypothetical protein ABKN59_007024 [Abortiporus biennis]
MVAYFLHSQHNLTQTPSDNIHQYIIMMSLAGNAASRMKQRKMTDLVRYATWIRREIPVDRLILQPSSGSPVC